MNQPEESPQFALTLPSALLKNCRVLPQRTDILTLLPEHISFCEVGVALGDFSEFVLKTCKISRFYAIDLFWLHGAPDLWDGKVGRELGERKHVEFYRERFKKDVETGVMEILQGDSYEMLKRLPPDSVDIFYVDAEHSYQSVKNELSIIKTKIRKDGIIILNDYIMADWRTNTKYGVVQATHEFMIREGWEMIYFALQSGMFCDVAIRKL